MVYIMFFNTRFDCKESVTTLAEFRDWSIDFPSNNCSHLPILVLRKTKGFLAFSGGIEMWHWTKISYGNLKSAVYIIIPLIYPLTNFMSLVTFYIPWKKKNRFPDVFSVYRKRLVTWNVLLRLCLLLDN